MSKMYVIQWKSKVNGRAGKGTKQFGREEGDSLVEELNREYPQIHHELADTAEAEPPAEQPQQEPEGPPAEQHQPGPDPAHAYS